MFARTKIALKLPKICAATVITRLGRLRELINASTWINRFTLKACVKCATSMNIMLVKGRPRQNQKK